MRYRLDRGDKKRTPCPSCGRVGTFRPYIDTETGEILGEAGVCDRENNCGFHRTPKQHFADLGIAYEERPKQYRMPPPKRTDWRCPRNVVQATSSSQGNTLGIWLVGLLGKRAAEALRTYRVGTIPQSASKRSDLRGAAIFWQIGSDGLERSGKVILYRPDGHRDKGVKPDWIHSMVTSRSMDEIGCGQCFFGEHLLSLRPEARVAIVESEKSAVICSILYPDLLWLAAGGSHGLGLDKCMVLAGRDVILFPDEGQIGVWESKAIDLEPLVSSIVVSDILEAIGAEQGSDIADYALLDDGSNWFAKNGVELIPGVKPVEIVPEEPVGSPIVDDSLPPILKRMFARNPNLPDLCAALDLDTGAMTITPIT